VKARRAPLEYISHKCVYLNVVYVLHICYKCFISILHMFAMVFKYFHVFLQLFHTHVSSVSSTFRRMLQCDPPVVAA
jgi:hypothetical protein